MLNHGKSLILRNLSVLGKLEWLEILLPEDSEMVSWPLCSSDSRVLDTQKEKGAGEWDWGRCPRGGARGSMEQQDSGTQVLDTDKHKVPVKPMEIPWALWDHKVDGESL